MKHDYIYSENILIYHILYIRVMNNSSIEIVEHLFAPKKVSKFRVRQTNEKDMSLKQILALEDGEAVFERYRERAFQRDGRDLLQHRHVKLCAKSAKDVSACKNKTQRNPRQRRQRNNDPVQNRLSINYNQDVPLNVEPIISSPPRRDTISPNTLHKLNKVLNIKQNQVGRQNSPQNEINKMFDNREDQRRRNTLSPNSIARLIQDVDRQIQNQHKKHVPVVRNKRRETLSPNSIARLIQEVDRPIQNQDKRRETLSPNGIAGLIRNVNDNENMNRNRRNRTRRRSPIMTRARARNALPVASRTRGRTRKRVR
jgi:hypothetical protein